MLSLTAAQQTALAKRHVMRRLFLWVEALDPDTGAADPAGFWNDAGTVTVGARSYTGSGTVIGVASLSATSDLTIPGLRITLSGLEASVSALIRGSTVGQRPIELHAGIFDTETRALVGDLIPRFVGIVDDVEIETPRAGSAGAVTLICESTSRALTIRRTETRSEATQHQRDPNDDFYRYTGLQRGKPLYFGRPDPR